MPVAASSALSTARLLSAANTVNSTLVKGSDGTVKRVTGYNAGVISYLKLYDKATAPTVGTDTPRKTIYLPADTPFSLDMDDYYGAGIGFGLTTAAADNSTAAVAAGAVLGLNIDYI